MINNQIIILGGNHHNTLGVIRSVGEAGLKPIVLIHAHLNAEKDCFVLRSKYVGEGSVIKTLDEGFNKIRKIASETEFKPIIISCGDSISAYINEHLDELQGICIVPGCKEQGKMIRLMDKTVMGQLAVDCGMQIPPSWIVEDAQIENVPIEYPCITKPLASIQGSKGDIHVCQDANELKSYLTKSNCRKIEVQRFIKKTLEYQLIGCSINGGETVIIPGHSEILRSSSVTNTGFLHYMSNDGFNYDHAACVRFLKACGYSGLFSLEFIRDANGQDYFLEINFRNDGNACCVLGAGVNLPYIWVKHCAGEDISSEKTTIDRPIYVMPEYSDIIQYLNGDMSLRTWIRDIHRADYYMEYNRLDPAPFWAMMRVGWRAIASTFVRKKILRKK